MSSIQTIVLISFSATLIALWMKPSPFCSFMRAMATATIVLMFGTTLGNIASSCERQAVAAEQSLKLLQQPGTMSNDLGELVKVLKEFQAMAAAEAASVPKR